MPGAVAKKKRKDELSQEDRFLQLIEEGTTWVQAHTRAVLMILVAIALLAGGVLYYRSYRESLRTRAAIELNQLRATLTTADAIPRLTGFVARFDGTPSATEGRLLLAKIQLQGGSPETALEVLRPLSSEPVDLPSGYAVKLLLAEAYKNAGQPERALGQLDAIIAGAQVPYQQHRALAERGRILADLGRLEEAAAAYQRLVDEGATDDLYRVRLGEIQAILASGATPDPTTFSAPAPVPPPAAILPDTAAADGSAALDGDSADSGADSVSAAGSASGADSVPAGSSDSVAADS